MSADDYRTVARPAVAELEVRRSRFVCAVWPVGDREEAERRIREWSAAHPRATHHVFAYRLGTAGLVEACSDAGEPPGTAGRPCLDVLRRQDLRQVALVVSRTFGGILLGTGGLKRAYAEAARAGVEAAGVVTMRRGERWRLHVPYAAWDRIQALLARMGGRVEHAGYGAEGVAAEVWVPAGAVAALRDLLGPGGAGGLRGEPVGEGYAPWPGSPAGGGTSGGGGSAPPARG